MPALETVMAFPLGSGEAMGEPLSEGVGTWTPQPATTSASSPMTRGRDLMFMLRGIRTPAPRRSTRVLPVTVATLESTPKRE